MRPLMSKEKLAHSVKYCELFYKSGELGTGCFMLPIFLLSGELNLTPFYAFYPAVFV